MLVCNHLYYLELLWTKGLFIPQSETFPRISYASGGRVVASSNLVIPTTDKALIIDGLLMLFLLKRE